MALTLEEMMLIAQQMKQEEGDSTLYDALAYIETLPLDQQKEALAQLAMDYEGRGTTLRDSLEKNFALATQEGPQTSEGPQGNRFAYTTAASPLEHLASGVQQYQGAKGVREDKASLEALSKAYEGGVGVTQQGILQAQQAKALRGERPFWMPEEEEKKKRFSLFRNQF